MKWSGVRTSGHSGLGVIQSSMLVRSLGHFRLGSGSSREGETKGAGPPETAVHALAHTSASDLDIL